MLGAGPTSTSCCEGVGESVATSVWSGESPDGPPADPPLRAPSAPPSFQHDHTHFKHLLGAWRNELKAPHTDATPRRLADIAKHLIHDLSTHAIFEAAFIAPLTDEATRKDASQRDVAIAAVSVALESSLSALAKEGDIQASNLAFDALSQLLETDMASEDKSWKNLASRLERPQLLSLLQAYHDAQALYPSHPHPLIFNIAENYDPLFTRAIAPMLGVADRTYDMMTGFPAKTSGSSITVAADGASST